MVLLDIGGFVIASLIMIKASQYALQAISGIEKNLKMSSFIVSFFLIGLVSAFPEGFVAIVSAINKVPTLGFGALMGSVIADLTIILGIVGIVAGRSKLEKGFRHEIWLLVLLMLPIILAFDGTITRADGLILIAGCFMFFFNLIQKHNVMKKIVSSDKRDFTRNVGLFIAASTVVFISAKFVVDFAESFANGFGLSLLVVGLVFISLSTSLPEFVFAITAARKKLADVAVGELMGVVIIDATLLMGIMALIEPIKIEGVDLAKIGIFVVTALALAAYFLRKERVFSLKDGVIMVFVYVIFIITELTV